MNTMYNLISHRPSQIFEAPGPTASLVFFPDGVHAVHISSDAKLATLLHIPEGSGSKAGSWRASACVASVSRDGKLVICGGKNGKLTIWDTEALESHNPRVTTQSHREEVTAIDTSPSLIASGAWNSSICLWNLRGESLVGPLFLGNSKVTSLRFSPSGDHLAACIKKNVFVWKVDNSSRPIQIVNAPLPHSGQTVVWSYDGRYVFAGSALESALTTVVDVFTRSIREEPVPCPHSVSSDGEFIVCGAPRAGVQLFDAATRAVIKHHIPKHIPLAISPDGHSLVTIPEGHGRSLAVWRLQDRLDPDNARAVSTGNKLPQRFSIPCDVKSLVERSWDDWLRDAERAIKSNSDVPQDYDNYVALRAAQPTHDSFDPQLSDLPHSSAVDFFIDDLFRHSPHVLIDTRTGHLCDASQRKRIFKSDPIFKELISVAGKQNQESMARIKLAAEAFCRYVTFSHTWHSDDEPSFQYVSGRNSVHNLEDTFVDNKLRKLCEIVRALGYWWAWSDTCCIDKLKEAVLREAMTSMYRWYRDSALTLAFLADVEPGVGDLIHTRWMQRAWTLQELIAPKVILFYDSTWQPYRNDPHLNHKSSPLIMQELLEIMSKTSTSAETTLLSFDSSNLTPREKLRLASTRKATRVEDVAYSLIGIFRSDIAPNYGENKNALGRLLEEIVEREGDVAILDWTGTSSEFNSALPADISVYQETPVEASSAPNTYRMKQRVEELRTISSVAQRIYRAVTSSSWSRAHFTTRRLHLPCIIFPVTRLYEIQDNRREHTYRATVSAIGKVDIVTNDVLLCNKMNRGDLCLVYPWIVDLRCSLRGATWGDCDNQLPHSDQPRGDTEALRLIVRLEQKFTALVLQKQSEQTYRRVAADRKIVVQVRETSQLGDVCTDVLEIE